MQVSAINSTSFGNNYSSNLDDEIQRARKSIETLREFSDSFEFEPVASDNLEDKPAKKSFIGTAASVVLGTALIFGLVKNGYKKGIEKYAGSKLNEFVTSKGWDQTAKSLVNKFAGKHTKIAEIYNKIGTENVVAGVSSLGTMGYVASTDGNHNGVADIAEKGINAYENAVKRLGMAKTILDLVA